jgi:hypothetical protein
MSSHDWAYDSVMTANLYKTKVKRRGPGAGKLLATCAHSWKTTVIAGGWVTRDDDGALAGSRQLIQITSVRAQCLHWIGRSSSPCRENTGGRGASPEHKN